MTREHLGPTDPRIASALTELEERIRGQFPSATFAVTEEDDPTGVYLTATVDLDDPDTVMDVIGDRLLELEVDEGLPVYVVPVRTPERIARLVAQRTSAPQPHLPMSQRPLPL